MKIPKEMTEAEVVAVIDKVCKRLAYKFVFGYFDYEDIYQQARIFAVEGMDTYRIEHGHLENFLQVHVKNRLINFKRDKFERLNKPCLTCPHYDPEGTKSESQCLLFVDKTECRLWNNWFTRNTAKKNLMQPIDLSEVIGNAHEDKHNDDICENNLQKQELSNLIDKHISIDLREDYLKMISGIKVSRSIQLVIRNAILTILKQHNYGEDYS